MSKMIDKTGKSLDEALKLALDELQVTVDKVDYEIIEQTEKKSLFGLLGTTKQITVRVTVKEEPKEDKLPADIAKEFLQSIFNSMSIEVLIEKFVVSEDVIKLHLHGAHLGILIGKHGQTLDSLQYLTNLVTNKNKEKWVKIILDIENYRKKRDDVLVKLASRLADKVKRKGEKVTLEPMNAHERKVIHMTLQDDRRITTYSEGEEPHRYVVIMLKK